MFFIPAMNIPAEAQEDLPAAREYTPGEEGELEDRYRNERCEPYTPPPAEG